MFSTILKSLREKRGLNKKKMASLLNMPYTTYNNYETGTREPNSEILIKIAKEFNVSTDYLLGNNGASNYENEIDTSFTLSFTEQSLIKKYRTLSDNGKDTVNKTIDNMIEYEKSLYETCADEEQEYDFMLYDMPASAGTGQFLDSDAFTIIKVGKECPHNANFGVKICGDSMEPRLHDEDIAFVKRQQTIENGEIGIFVLNGSAYCKKYECNENGCCLVSLNKNFPLIQINKYDEIRVVGKVLNK